MADGTWFRTNVDAGTMEILSAVSKPRKISASEVAYSPLGCKPIGGVFGLTPDKMKVLELKHASSMEGNLPGIASPPGLGF